MSQFDCPPSFSPRFSPGDQIQPPAQARLDFGLALLVAALGLAVVRFKRVAMRQLQQLRSTPLNLNVGIYQPGVLVEDRGGEIRQLRNQGHSISKQAERKARVE